MSQSDLRGIRGIVFDLDDTLCTYWDAAKAGLRAAFAEAGPEGVSPEQMVQHWASAFRDFGANLKKTEWYPKYLVSGEPTRTEQMRLALLDYGIDDPAQAALLSKVYAEQRNSHLHLFDDALEVLNSLKGHFKLGLMTNGPADVQRQEIATTGIEAFFDSILIEGEVGVGKPDRIVFERAERELGCSPSELLFVGNSYKHDIEPALNFGWRAIWIRRASDVAPSARGPEVRDPQSPLPTAEIGDLKSLLQLLPVESTRL